MTINELRKERQFLKALRETSAKDYKDLFPIEKLKYRILNSDDGFFNDVTYISSFYIYKTRDGFSYQLISPSEYDCIATVDPITYKCTFKEEIRALGIGISAGDYEEEITIEEVDCIKFEAYFVGN